MVLGTTTDYRRALRIRYVGPQAERPLTVIRADSFHDL
jgi:hypothetical protein